MSTVTQRRTASGTKLWASIITTLTLVCCFCSFAFAQDTPEVHRKIVSKVAPAYPSLARTMNIKGNVKVEAVVSPSGIVKTTDIKGGHPVLVQAAQNAVTKWRWEPGTKETHELVVIQFDNE